MSDTKHTPGPWEVTPNGQVTHQPPMPPGRFVGFQGIAQVYGPGANPASRANAALIAAAPALLAVVETVVDQCPMCNAGEECQDDDCYAARAALARGEGGEPR